MNNVSLSFQVISLTVILGFLTLCGAYYAIKETHIANNFIHQQNIARSLFKEALKKKVTNQTEYDTYVKDILGNNDFGAYVCILNEDGSVLSPKEQDDWCKEKELIPKEKEETKLHKQGGELYYDAHDEFKVPLHQFSFMVDPEGRNPQFRIFFEQESFNLKDLLNIYKRVEGAPNQIQMLLVPIAPFFFFFPVIIFLIVRPLQRIAREVREVQKDEGKNVSNDNYPPEFSELANALNRFIAETRKAKKDAIEAKAETDAKRYEMLKEAYIMSKATDHQRENLIRKDELDKEVASYEKLKEDYRKLKVKMERLINKITDFTKKICELTKKDKSGQNESANIHKILEDLFNDYSSDYPNKNFEIEGLEKIQNIRVSIQPYILQNLVCDELLRNAEKYSDSEISIQVDRKDNRVRIEFHNDGQKFPEDEEKRQTLFDYGERANPESPTGTGFGLYFVKAVTDSGGCAIDLQNSEKLSGGCVYLEIPVSKMPQSNDLSIPPSITR